MPQVPLKFALKAEVAVQTRKAQAVDGKLAAAIKKVCEANRQIIACYLLDARKPDSGEMDFIIALTLDDEAAHMDLVALQFQAMLRQFPVFGPKTFIMSSAAFAEKYEGAEFYILHGK
jgi:hypothetical protein